MFRRGAGGKCWNILFTPLSRFLCSCRLVGKRIARRACQINFSDFASKNRSPGSDFVVFDGRGCVAKSTARILPNDDRASEPIIERVQSLLISSQWQRPRHRLRGNFRPAFAARALVHCALDAVDQEVVFRLTFSKSRSCIDRKFALCVVGLNGCANETHARSSMKSHRCCRFLIEASLFLLHLS